LYRYELNYWPIDAAGASRHNVCGFEVAMSDSAEDQEGQPSRQPGRSMTTSSFCTSSTPMPKSGRHPHRPLTFFGPAFARQFHESWAELRVVLVTILPFE
jgi:hypothetical protein